MATTIIACSGEGQVWVQNEDGNVVCPVCELTPKDLGIRIRVKNGKVTPVTVPGHDIEVDGTELKVNLVNGEFKVHTPTCPTLKKEGKESEYDRPLTVVAVDQRDAVLQLWDDQISESDIEDKDEPTDDDLEPYFGATEFHRCVRRVFQTEEAAKPKNFTRDSKRMLATLLIEAMGAVVSELETSDDEEARLVLKGMDIATAKQVAANWVHHFPADRKRWLESGMVKPQRSDWKEEAESTETEEEDTEQDAA